MEGASLNNRIMLN